MRHVLEFAQRGVADTKVSYGHVRVTPDDKHVEILIIADLLRPRLCAEWSGKAVLSQDERYISERSDGILRAGDGICLTAFGC